MLQTLNKFMQGHWITNLEILVGLKGGSTKNPLGGMEKIVQAEVSRRFRIQGDWKFYIAMLGKQVWQLLHNKDSFLQGL